MLLNSTIFSRKTTVLLLTPSNRWLWWHKTIMMIDWTFPQADSQTKAKLEKQTEIKQLTNDLLTLKSEVCIHLAVWNASFEIAWNGGLTFSLASCSYDDMMDIDDGITMYPQVSRNEDVLREIKVSRDFLFQLSPKVCMLCCDTWYWDSIIHTYAFNSCLQCLNW